MSRRVLPWGQAQKKLLVATIHYPLLDVIVERRVVEPRVGPWDLSLRHLVDQATESPYVSLVHRPVPAPFNTGIREKKLETK